MAYTLAYSDHVVVWVANTLASKYAEHILNVTVEEDTDNGKIVAIGDHIKMDNYKATDYTGNFEGEIEEMSSDGLWYVRIKKADGAFMLYNVPIIEAEFNDEIQKEKHFFNAKDDVVRAYQLHDWDRIALSEDGFVGTPEEGKKVTVDASGKLKVGN